MTTLVPMQQSEFETYSQRLIREYAKEHVEAGNWEQEGSLERSTTEINGLLPQGVDTPQQHLFSIHDDESGSNVGILWFAERKEGGGMIAFIYDIELLPDQRGKGYGKAAMTALEAKVKELGLKRISLHVFGKNRVAINLYEKMGYSATNLLMTKELGD